jgi:hypothetical protein
MFHLIDLPREQVDFLLLHGIDCGSGRCGHLHFFVLVPPRRIFGARAPAMKPLQSPRARAPSTIFQAT